MVSQHHARHEIHRGQRDRRYHELVHVVLVKARPKRLLEGAYHGAADRATELQHKKDEPDNDGHLIVRHRCLRHGEHVGGHEPAAQAHQDLRSHDLERRWAGHPILSHPAQAYDADACPRNGQELVPAGVRRDEPGEQVEDDEAQGVDGLLL
ncbi:hypothetical protein ISF_05141 [Cordyceps fumosorosea ARSEF 2679]|uniref:Uncharacterized protein n=1 Tax=Cordyceps fumosorosea (strain ARSEF 2679) TaxID=1081104 RepID=A0A167V1R6_CORFA|nr:hypothetical protein ISF_05141 [Cordyceps fumosorosea ARSEF 2679]OAA62132.1 hypothetical protein ISF_05141 [Cordyceps fumosorosea ARSEF 2679]